MKTNFDALKVFTGSWFLSTSSEILLLIVVVKHDAQVELPLSPQYGLQRFMSRWRLVVSDLILCLSPIFPDFSLILTPPSFLCLTFSLLP